jgi:hypothetical protein
MSTNRRRFTNHGFHLNNLAKEWLAKQIASQIELLVKFTSKANSAIPLKGKEEATDLNIEISMMPTEIDTVESLIHTSQTLNNQNNMINNESICRISTRNKKVPITMSKDFYGRFKCLQIKETI